MKRSKNTFKLNYQYRILLTPEQNAILKDRFTRLCKIHNLMLNERFQWWENNRYPMNACSIVSCPLPEILDQPDYYSQKRATHWFRESQAYLYESIHSQVIQPKVGENGFVSSQRTISQIRAE